MLGALGAEVIRVESTRHFPPASRGNQPYPKREAIAEARGLAGAYPDKDPGPDPFNRYGVFLLTGQTKRSVTLEVETPEGREALDRLVAVSDVVIENNARSIGNRLGYTWEAFEPHNPKIVLVRMAPLGLSGPYADARGFGLHLEALTGLASLSGHPDAPPAEAGSTLHMDDVSASGVAFAVMAALRQVRKTGRGTQVEFPQGEYLMRGYGDVLLGSLAPGAAPPGALGNRHSSYVQGCYPTLGDDQWIALTVRDDAEWQALVEVMGNPEWAAKPEFADPLSRRRHQDDLDPLLADFTRGRDKTALFLSLQQAGVPAAPVYKEDDAYADPHFREHRVFREVTHPLVGTHKYPAFGAHFSDMDLAWERPAPLLGADNEYVYKEILGYSDAEYDDLNERGLIGTAY